MAGGFVVAVESGLVAIYDVVSPSMEPTLHCAGARSCAALDDDRVLVVRYLDFDVGRGDIIVFTPPKSGACGGGRPLIKRVVGLPGETVSARDGRILINGSRYEKPAGYRDFSRRRVPRGSYFVLGDNGRLSCDSRSFGSIPRRNIVGRAIAIVWPFSRLGAR